ncbi:hypothetical protein CCACVL1_26423 [Corchorus capsularis]|uniref:Peptidase C1A papain C-terminal domain-containing protein n=1 Tax=Corchorus capsularis TaxID=210143 RepID=A0A1R3GEU1_COCAP|nr:hypothetical protein CCACVL1_26423 [Corchorus capsularis]
MATLFKSPMAITISTLLFFFFFTLASASDHISMVTNLNQNQPSSRSDDEKNAKVVTIDGYEDVIPFDEMSLKKAVAHQPVSVAIEAGGRAFQLYESFD